MSAVQQGIALGAENAFMDIVEISKMISVDLIMIVLGGASAFGVDVKMFMMINVILIGIVQLVAIVETGNVSTTEISFRLF